MSSYEPLRRIVSEIIEKEPHNLEKIMREAFKEIGLDATLKIIKPKSFRTGNPHAFATIDQQNDTEMNDECHCDADIKVEDNDDIKQQLGHSYTDIKFEDNDDIRQLGKNAIISDNHASSIPADELVGETEDDRSDEVTATAMKHGVITDAQEQSNEETAERYILIKAEVKTIEQYCKKDNTKLVHKFRRDYCLINENRPHDPVIVSGSSNVKEFLAAQCVNYNFYETNRVGISYSKVQRILAALVLELNFECIKTKKKRREYVAIFKKVTKIDDRRFSTMRKVGRGAAMVARNLGVWALLHVDLFTYTFFYNMNGKSLVELQRYLEHDPDFHTRVKPYFEKYHFPKDVLKPLSDVLGNCGKLLNIK